MAQRSAFFLQRPQRPASPEPVLELGPDCIFGLRADGTVLSAGSNHYGQCEVSHWRDIVKLYTTSYHTIGLRADGTVAVAGGRGTKYHNKPIAQFRTEAWRDIVDIAADNDHLVGLRADGTVVATGTDREYSGKHSPMLKVGFWTNIVSVHVAEYATIGLRADGTVVGVGSNPFGADRGLSAMSGVARLIVSHCNTYALDAAGNMIHVAGVDEDLYARNVQDIHNGADYTLILHRDGTVTCIPSQEPDYAPEVSTLRNVAKLYDTSYCTAFLHSDGTVSLRSPRKGQQLPNGKLVSSWENITALALVRGERLAGLRADGAVLVLGEPNPGEPNTGFFQAASWNLKSQPQPAPAENPQWTCPRCGNQNRKGKFCTDCGQKRP